MVNIPTFVSVPTFGSSAAKTQPPGATFSGGYLPGQVFPAEHENWFMAGLTENGNTEQDSIESVVGELKTILTAAGLTPNPAVVNQVYAALNALYLGMTAAGLLAPKASPTFTGNVVVPTSSTAANAVNNTRLSAVSVLLAPLASPALTGNPTAPTQAALNNSTRLATTAYTDGAVAKLATPITVNSGTSYALVSKSTPTLLIDRTTNPFPVTLPAATGSGYEVDIVNISALSTGLVKIIPATGEFIGVLAANVACYLQNVDQSTTVFKYQHIKLKDASTGAWEVVSGQFMPEPGSVDTAGSQYFLGKMRHLPVRNTTSRIAYNTNPATTGNWTSAIQATGLFGVPAGAKAIKCKVVVTVQPTAAANTQTIIRVGFSDNNTSAPTAGTSHPFVEYQFPAVTTSQFYSMSFGEMDVPLNSSGQFFMNTNFLLNLVNTNANVLVTITGYYMGD